MLIYAAVRCYVGYSCVLTSCQSALPSIPLMSATTAAPIRVLCVQCFTGNSVHLVKATAILAEAVGMGFTIMSQSLCQGYGDKDMLWTLSAGITGLPESQRATVVQLVKAYSSRGEIQLWCA